jgi:hypothetical protein
MPETLTAWVTLVVAVLGWVVGLLTFMKAVHEYVLKNRLIRFEKFEQIDRVFFDGGEREKLWGLLLHDKDAYFSDFELGSRMSLAGYIEHIGLMVNSGLISKEVAHSTWGAGVIACWESATFWDHVNKKDGHWIVYQRFYELMKGYDVQAKREPSPASRYRF